VRAVVAGAGAYGLACAERLARAGASVAVLEADRPANPRAASGGLTRVLRFEYGSEGRYTDMTLRAVERWRALEGEAGDRVFEQRGVLHLASGDGVWERQSYETVRATGVEAELLEPAEVARRWPAFAVGDVAFALYSPAGGFLRARRGTELLAAAAEAAGVELRVGARVTAVEEGVVHLADGSSERGDVVVLCTGSWSAGVDDRLRAIVPTRQVTAYFDGSIGDAPVFGDGGLDFYGMPEHDGLGVKIGWHRVHDRVAGDPSSEAEREVAPPDIEPLRGFAARRLPGLARAPVLDADVCFYAMTPDENPIVDRLDERTVVCAGLSGHGFKYSPVLGAAAAELALGLEPSVDLRGFEVDRRALVGVT
jgi:glycine/D-amino acid oxidase-like deaminating enzyme